MKLFDIVGILYETALIDRFMIYRATSETALNGASSYAFCTKGEISIHLNNESERKREFVR